MFQRVLIIVLDGVGIGALPDAAEYGDQATATLQHVGRCVGGLTLPTLQKLGLGRIEPIAGVSSVPSPMGCWGKMAEKSAGKDSVSGHWELAGIIQKQPFATFPDGFPDSIISSFVAESGFIPLGNIAASGTDILRVLGEDHLRTGQPIVYTSSDSVFQIAAHEQILPPEHLYDLCRKVKQILTPWNVCRVIARPFKGTSASDFYRTSGRRDFAVKPPQPNLLSLMQGEGLETLAVGKIHDLYSGEGFTDRFASKTNAEGMKAMLMALKKIKRGLVMTNLVDFDMLYGHRRDAVGFADALQEFDAWLPALLDVMLPDDLLLITADHGCDPTAVGTDHTREYVPLLAYAKTMQHTVSLGVRQSLSDVGATVCDNFGLRLANGSSFLVDIENK